MVDTRDRARRSGPAGEDGRVALLVAGTLAVVVTLVLGVIGLTAVQLARIQLRDAADAAAVDAADAIDVDSFYGGGLGPGVPLTDGSVQTAAQSHLSARPIPSRIADWAVAGGTGTPDGRTAVVVLQGRADVPMISAVIGIFGADITITVESTARSDLD